MSLFLIFEVPLLAVTKNACLRHSPFKSGHFVHILYSQWFALYCSLSTWIMVCSIEHYLYRCCQISSEMLIHKIITVRHKTDRSNQHCTQSCSIPSHLGWWSNVAIKPDWFSRPRASVQHASAQLCARPARLCVRLHMRVFVPILSAWVTRMRNRAHSKVFYTKHLPKLGRALPVPPLCTALEGLFMFSFTSQVPENDLFQLQDWSLSFIFPFNTSLIQHTCCRWLKCLSLNHYRVAAAERRPNLGVIKPQTRKALN